MKKLIILLIILSAMTTTVYAWRNGPYSTDPYHPGYGTHDYIAIRAYNMLPSDMQSKIDIRVMSYGTELPDCNNTSAYCLHDTNPHRVYYYGTGKLEKDYAAKKAQEEYVNATNAYNNGDKFNFSMYIGIMAHYMSDLSVAQHTMGSGSDWGPGTNESGYENTVEDVVTGKSSVISYDDIVFDGTYRNINAYNAALKLAYDTTFDTTFGDGTRNNTWMDKNYNNGTTFWSRNKQSIAYNINLLADVMYTLIASFGPTPAPVITNYSPALSVQGIAPYNKTFSITTDQEVNTTWTYDTTIVKQNHSVTEDSYIDTFLLVGDHSVKVDVQNTNGAKSKTWSLKTTGTFTLTKDMMFVYVGIPQNITFTVVRLCGTEFGDNCNSTYVPAAGVKIIVNASSNTTDQNGIVIVNVNEPEIGIVNTTAKKTGYIDYNDTISVMAIPPTNNGGGDNSGGSSSSGGGGGGGGSAEPYENIYKYEVKDKFISINPVIYSYVSPEIPVYELVVIGTQNDEVSIKLEVLKSISKLVNISPPGNIYKNINMWANSKRLKNISIRYKIENPWMSDNSLDDNNVKLLGWKDGKWQDLTTKIIDKDDKYTYFESDSGRLSTFAISGIKEGVTSVPETTIISIKETDIKKTDVGAPAPTKVSGFEIIAVIVAISIVYVFKRKEQK